MQSEHDDVCGSHSAPQEESCCLVNNGRSQALHLNYGSTLLEQSVDDSPICRSISSVSPTIHVYHRRWYILLVFSLLAFMQGGLGNVWSVIAGSVEIVFGWTDIDISLMQIWLYLAYLVSMFPFAWLIDQKGLRISLLISAGLLVLGTALRCVTIHTPAATWLAHIAHIAVGLAGPVSYAAGPYLSSLWFPPEQRSTATAVATVSGFAGGAGCFIFGPLMVESPKLEPIVPSIFDNGTDSNVNVMQHEILFCRYIECGICVLILIMAFIYFPSRPPASPSITAAMGKLSFISGLKDLFSRENLNFWFLCFPFAMSLSIYGVWNGLFGVNLKELVEQRDIGWIGFAAVLAGAVAAVVLGRMSDLCCGHMKLFLLLLNVMCIASTFWFLLIAQKYILYSRVQLYLAAVLQGLSNNGAVPLYFELAIETTYPVTEVCVSTIMNILYNVLPLLFLLIFLIPNVGTHWMNWCIYGVVLACFPFLLVFKEKYKRLMVDKGRALVPESIQNSFQENLSYSNRAA